MFIPGFKSNLRKTSQRTNQYRSAGRRYHAKVKLALIPPPRKMIRVTCTEYHKKSYICSYCPYTQVHAYAYACEGLTETKEI